MMSHRAFVALISLLLWKGAIADARVNYVKLGVHENKQKFVLQDYSESLFVSGKSINFQHDFSGLYLGGIFSSSTGKKNFRGSNLSYDNQALSLFASYSFDDAWVGSSIFTDEEKVDFNFSGGRLSTRRESELWGVGLDGGYRFYSYWGQLVTAMNVNWQLVEEQQQFDFEFLNGVPRSQESDIEDETIASTFIAEYGYLYLLTDKTNIYLSAGLIRTVSLMGDLIVKQHISRSERLVRTSTDSQSSNTAITSHLLQMTIYVDDVDIHFSVERVDNQPLANAFKEVSLGIAF